MILRPWRQEDINGLLRMWNRSARFDPLGPELLMEKIEGDADYRPEMTLVAEDNEHLTGFVMGVARSSSEARRGFVKMIAVDCGRQREGIGSRLLKAVEACLVTHDVQTIRICESAPNYLTPGIDARYAGAGPFFEKHGYRRFGKTHNLSVDLGAETFSMKNNEHTLARQGIDIRRARVEDWPAVETFLEQHWPTWQTEVHRSLHNEPPGLHLALQKDSSQKDRLLAFAAYDSNNTGTGWFGPMGTAPGSRGLGIGGVLLHRCLCDIRAQGLRYAVIPWVGPIGFYEHHAKAKIDRVFHRYEKLLTDTLSS